MITQTTVNLKGKNLFNQLTREQRNHAYPGKGRSKDLVEARNKLLFYRFYYYSKIMRLRYEDVLVALCAEFFLSPRTVADCLSSKYDLAKEIFAEEKSPTELKQMYKFLNWNN